MKFTNDQGLPLSLAVYLAHDEYPEHREGVISATGLLKPIKEMVLSRRVAKGSKQEDVAGRIASTFGTSIHNGIEAAWTHANIDTTLANLGYAPGLIECIKVNPKEEDIDEDTIAVYTEFRTERKLGDWIISGEFDFLADGRLRDFKSTGVFTYMNKTNDAKYIKQGSIYRWLNPEKVTDPVMAIDYIFTDWSALAARTQANYPPLRMMEQTFPLDSLWETEKFIEQKLAMLDRLIDAPESEIPACTPEDLWVGPSKFKYYKNPQSLKRATRVYDSNQEAVAHQLRDGSVGIVMEVKDNVKACKYCSAYSVCEQANRYLNSGELKL